MLKLPYFFEYNAHTSIVRTWISQWFLTKKLFYFSRIMSQEIIIASLFIIEAILNPFPILPCIVRREYFSNIFHVKKCALYSIKHGTSLFIETTIYMAHWLFIIMTFSIIPFRLTTLSISIKADTQYKRILEWTTLSTNEAQHKSHSISSVCMRSIVYAYVFFIVILSVIKLNVTMLIAIMLSIVMLSVLAPLKQPKS